MVEKIRDELDEIEVELEFGRLSYQLLHKLSMILSAQELKEANENGNAVCLICRSSYDDGCKCIMSEVIQHLGCGDEAHSFEVETCLFNEN